MIYKKIAAVMLVGLLAVGLVACVESPHLIGQDTPRPGQPDPALMQRQLDAQATADASRLNASDADRRAAAYRQMLSDQIAQATADAGRLYGQQTQVAGEATRQAEGTATQQAWMVIGWTATANAARSALEAQQTAVSGFQTVTAVKQGATATQVIIDAIATKVALDNERAAQTNTIKAIWPYAVSMVLLMAGLTTGAVLLIKHWKRLFVYDRDERGDAPILGDNSGNIYDADRNIGSAAQFKRNGMQYVPLGDQAEQARVTRRDQAMDMGTRGLPLPAGTPTILPPSRALGAGGVNPTNALMTGQQAAQIYKIFAPDDPEFIGKLPPATEETLEGEWTAAD